MSRLEAEKNMMSAPLLGMFSNLGMANHEDPRHFDTGTLGWSIARLFLHYERVVKALESQPINRAHAEADIEAFIVRMRIALNDLAYLIAQLYPRKLQGFPGPSGDDEIAHRDKEVSISDLIKSMDKNPSELPEFLLALSPHRRWIISVRNSRNRLVHYKQKVLIFSESPARFMFVSAVGVERASVDENGVGRIRTEEAIGYLNSHLCMLLRLLNVEMVVALENYIERLGLKYAPYGENPRIGAMGIWEFMRRNQLDA